MDLLVSYLPVIFLGLGVGLISSILGLGGGVLIVPLLPVVLGMSQYEAVGTSLATIFMVVSMNSFFFARKKMIVWPIVGFLGPLTAVGSFVSGRVAQNLPETSLKIVLLVVLFIFALRAMIGIKPKGAHSDAEVVKQPLSKWKSLLAVGGLGGVVSGLTGVGSGMIVNIALLHLKLAANRFVAPTAQGVLIFTTSFGAASYFGLPVSEKPWQFGFIHADYALILLASASLSSYFGRKNQHLLEESPRRIVLGVLLSALVIRTFLRIL